MFTWKRKAKVGDAEKRLSDFVRMVSDWMWETNADLRFTVVSDRTFEIFRLPPHKMLGSTFEEIGVTTSGGLAIDSSRNPFRDREVQFVTYPREPHGLREKAHQLDYMRRTLEWFDRWVKQGKK